MDHRRGLLLVCLTLFAIGTPESATAQALNQAIKIPALHASALNGDTILLPEALQGKAAILVLGFSQSSREQVTVWGKRLAADYRESPTVLYYEMPVLAAVPRLLRGIITSRIKSSVPLPAQPRFVPVDSNEAAWKQATQYNQPNDAYILLVDSQGFIRSRLQGPPTDATYIGLRSQIEHVLSTPAKP